jgi:hypothetical protein
LIDDLFDFVLNVLGVKMSRSAQAVRWVAAIGSVLLLLGLVAIAALLLARLL